MYYRYFVLTIATLPHLLFAVLVLIHVKLGVQLPLLATIYTSFILLIILMLIRTIFLGPILVITHLNGVVTGMGEKGPVIRSTIALLLVAILLAMGLLFYALNGSLDILLEILLGCVIAVGAWKYESFILQKFQVKPIYKGISLREIPQYISWYHYIVLFLIAILLVAFFAEINI